MLSRLVRASVTTLPRPALTMNLMTISDSVKQSLSKSGVIPTVVHDTSFTPKGFLTIQFPSGKEVALGNTLTPAESHERPRFDFTLNIPGDSVDELTVSKDDRFTLAFTDPDAPEKGDETWSEYCHYLSVDLELNALDGAQAQLTTANLTGHDLFPYVGPAPPPKTGKHRYCFILYKQKPGVTPETIKDRGRWGTDIPGYGAAEYAEKNGLVPYAVNFFYAQDAVQ